MSSQQTSESSYLNKNIRNKPVVAYKEPKIIKETEVRTQQIRNSLQITMNKQKKSWFTTMNSCILIPLYVCLAPLCIVSSSLFDWMMSWVYIDQTVTLVVILVFEWTISALLIFELMYNRRGNSIFYYQFVFFLVCANFILIGTSYSLLHRYDILEQFAAKVCTSLMLILAAQKMKIKFKDTDSSCSICLEKMNEECIILKCKHYFHESCLWEWSYVKPECPSCRQSIC